MVKVEGNENKCSLCGQQMTLLEIGGEPWRVWVHRGEQLKRCKAILPSESTLPELLRNMERMKRKFRLRLIEPGKVKPHGSK